MAELPRPSGIRMVGMLDLADRLVGACLARSAVTANVTREQWRTLILLDDGALDDGSGAPGHTMGEIAQRAAVPAPTATRMVDKLVADGLAFRRSDPWDRRRVLVHISGEGHTLVTRAGRELDEVLGAVLPDLDLGRGSDLLDLLDRLLAALGPGHARV